MKGITKLLVKTAIRMAVMRSSNTVPGIPRLRVSISARYHPCRPPGYRNDVPTVDAKASERKTDDQIIIELHSRNRFSSDIRQTRISHSPADPRKKSMKNDGTPNQRFITVSATYAPRTPAQFSTRA